MQCFTQSCFIGLLALLLMACSSSKQTASGDPADVAAAKPAEQSPLSGYDDFTLWRNWAFSSCIAKTFKDHDEIREDAYRTASGYFEFGSGLDIYGHLSNLAEAYLKGQAYYTLKDRKEIKLLKCIDFFHSAELRDMLMLEDTLTRQFTALRAGNAHININALRQQLKAYDLRQTGQPLTHALYLMEFALENMHFEVVKLLIALGVNPDKETQSYGSTLDFAFRKDDDPRHLEAMLDGGLSPNHSHPGQEPMLHRAIARSGLNQVKLLVARGSAINAANGQGVSALSAAIASGKPDIALYLVEQGALFNHADRKAAQSAVENLSNPSLRDEFIKLRDVMTEKAP